MDSNQNSNKPLIKLNFILCALYWLCIYPISHLGVIFDGDNFSIFQNLVCLIFLTLICANCLWYLNRNLIIYKSPIFKALLIPLGLSTLSLIFHIQKITEEFEEILPILSFIIVIFSLHQIRCSEEKRNNIMFLIILGSTINVILQDTSLVAGFSVRTCDCDQLIAGISIIINLYLLLHNRYSIFNLIGNLFIQIILFIFVLHHLNLQFIFISLIPLAILITLLCKENTRIGLSVLAIMGICTWVCYYLGFFKNFNINQEFQDFVVEFKSDLKTAYDFFLFGSGANTFPFAHLHSNPNIYDETPTSALLYRVITGGLLSCLSALTFIGIIIRYSFGSKNNRSQQIANLALTLPLIIIGITTNFTNESITLFMTSAYVIWYVTNQSTINKKTVKPLDIKIRRVPIVLVSSAIIFFCATGIISIKKYNDIIENNQCEDINESIPNPFVLGKMIVKHEMDCVWTNINSITVLDWFENYRRVTMNEIIPYYPYKEIFINLINASDKYTDEQNLEIKTLAEKLYPTIMSEISIMDNSTESISK